jgi:predicted ester cyclase
MADNANLVRSLMEAWNRRDFDYIADRATPDTILIDAGSGETFKGPEGGRKYNTMWADGFPDGRITIDRVVEAGDDLVIAEYTGNGTHTGTLSGNRGTIPPTGRSVTLHFCDVYEIKDGKVRKQTTYGDSGALMAQLGLMATQPSTTA